MMINAVRNGVGMLVVVLATLMPVVAQSQRDLSTQFNQLQPQPHAHNDYLHPRPLWDALQAGFSSVEADVFLVDGELLIAHSANEIKAERTLQALYLDPLRQRIAEQGGQVQATDASKPQPFWLLIDIKSEALATYRQLHAVLAEYADILSSVEGDKVSPRAIQVVISGNRPQEFIATQSKRYCGIDGRLSDLNSTYPAHLMPMISDNWGLNFSWRGSGPMPPTEQKRLHTIVSQAHAQGRVVRFWATPEKEELWQVLVESGVDLINTDQLQQLSEFLR